MPHHESILPIFEKYFGKDPELTANYLATIDEDDAVAIVKTLPLKVTAKLLPRLKASYAAVLLNGMTPGSTKEILEKLEPQFVSQILTYIPADEQSNFLSSVSEDLKIKIRELLTYPEDSVGRCISTDYMAFPKGIKIKDLLHKLRLLNQKKRIPISYTYVLDEGGRLAGIVNMYDIVTAMPDTLVENVMRKNVFTLDPFMEKEQAATELTARRYLTAPVVDNEGKLLGVIRPDRLVEGVKEMFSEDIMRMVGAGGDEKTFSPLLFKLKKRLPWLHVNLLTAFLAASVVGLFENIIGQITVLAVFLPIVAGQGGNAGAQSLAVVMRGMVMREIPKGRVKTLVLTETIVGIVNGFVIGAVTGVISWAWKGNAYLGLVIGLGMIVNLTAAGLSGALIPVTMKAMRLDPAQCSSIILTTITDVVGFFAFLGFAVLFQNLLM